MSTGIGWTDETWNMWPGCVPSSPGCAHCWARHPAWRMSYNPNPKVSAPYLGIVKKVLADGTEIRGGEDHPRRREKGVLKFTGLTRFVPERLAEPLSWRKPRRVFVSANSDLFLPSRVATEEGRRQIAAVYGAMAACPQHTFQVLTKWPGNAREWFAWLAAEASEHMTGVFPDAMIEICITAANDHLHEAGERDTAEELFNRWVWAKYGEYGFEAEEHEDVPRIERLQNRLSIGPEGQIDEEAWPLPNVHFLTSVEDQQRADERIPELMRVPAVLHGLSIEPLLGPVDLSRWMSGPDQGAVPVGTPPTPSPIGWAIVGGESGAKARPCEVRWIRALVEQCKAAEVPVFAKQLGAVVHADEDFPYSPSIDGRVHLDDAKGADMSEWPDDLRVQEMPP